jgi:hypothetical protein
MEERNMRRDKGEIDSWIYNGITTSIQEQIMEHMNAIRSLEEELERLKTDDICQDFDMDNAIRGESLWRNLELIEKKPSSYTRNDVRFDEDPCYATLDLVVEKLLHTPKSPLQLKGCSIQSLGTSVRFCISGVIDENICERRDEQNQPHGHRKKC